MERPTALRIETVTDGIKLGQACRNAVQDGFDGIEWVAPPGPAELNPTGWLTSSESPTPLPDTELRVVAVAVTCLYTDVDLASERVTTILDQAAALGARCVNVAIPPLRRRRSNDGFPHYQDALNFAYELLRRVRFAAEAAGVAIALEAGAGGVLLSPVELRELVDLANSWVVGVCVDVQRVSEIGRAADWLQTLGYRVHAVRFQEPGPGEPPPFQSREMADALAGVPRERPFIVAGHSAPADLRAYLQSLGGGSPRCGGGA